MSRVLCHLEKEPFMLRCEETCSITLQKRASFGWTQGTVLSNESRRPEVFFRLRCKELVHSGLRRRFLRSCWWRA